MTRNEFLEDVNSWYELLNFCYENDCDICEDIVSDDDRDDEIDSDVADAIRNDRWYDIKNYLEEIPTGYDYYLRTGTFEYSGLDDYDFDRYKNDVLAWADNEGDIWDADEEEDDDRDVFAEQAAAEEDNEPAPEEEDFTVGDLIGMCCVAFATIQQADAKRMQEEERRVRELYPKVLK